MSRTISLMSAAGGQGVSILACYLASAAAREGGSVLLIDSGPGFGALRWLLAEDVMVSYDLGDAVRAACLLGDAVFRTAAGFYLMPSAADDSGVTPQKIARIIDVAARSFDFVITDCGTPGITGAKSFAEAGGISIICTEADKMHLSSASWLRRSLPEEDSRCRLAVMKFSLDALKRGDCENIDTAIDTVGARLVGVVPFDRSASAALSGGGLAQSGRTAIAASNIIGRIMGKSIPLSIK